MISPLIQSLLILQDRDLKRLGLEAQLKSVPGDIARVEQKIAAEKAAIDVARTELRELEVRKKSIETEIGSAEEKVGRYRTQQLSIRKNDEYQALGHEIATVQAQISELEGKELEVMYSIDEARKKFAAAEAELKTNISGHETRIKTLREREASLARSGGRSETASLRSDCGPEHACRRRDPRRQMRGLSLEGIERGRIGGARQRRGPAGPTAHLRPVRPGGLLGQLRRAARFAGASASIVRRRFPRRAAILAAMDGGTALSLPANPAVPKLCKRRTPHER